MKYLLKIVYIPAILWMAIIFGFSGDDGDKSSSLSMVITERVVDFLDIKEEKSVERLHTPIRKLAHMSEYAVLFILIYLAVFLDVRGKYQRKNLGCLSIILCAFYACLDEFHQLYVPGREGKVSDICIDIIGALLGALFLFCIHQLTQAYKECKCQKRLHRN